MMQKRGSRHFTLETFKPHALKVAEAARARHLNPEEATDPEAERLAEFRQWRNHIVDLHRVLSVSQAMFLLLEHNNEALLRVAVEIATCSDSQKALWWKEGWYSDEVAREWFRKQVKDKLGHCMNAMNLGMDDEDKEELEKAAQELFSKAEEAEKQRLAEQSLRESTELRLEEVKKAFEKAMKESTSHIKELEKNLDKMRAEVKKSQGIKVVEDKTEAVEKQRALAEAAQQKLLMMEEQRRKVEEQIAKMEADHDAYARKSMAAISDGQMRVKDLEAQVKQMQKALELEQQRPKQVQQVEKIIEAPAKKQPAALPKEVPAAAAAPAPVNDHKAEEELRRWLDLEQKRAEEFRQQAETHKAKVSTLEGEVAKFKDEIASLKAELAKSREDLLAARKALGEKRLEPERERPASPPRVVEKIVEVEKPVEQAKRKSGIDEEEHQKVLDQLEKLRKRNASLREANEELKTENEAYEKKNMQLLRMLNQVKDQLKRITEIAEKKGYGKIVKDIMEESKVTETFEAPEFTAFDRLWRDAQRRQERQKIQNEVRMGLRDRSELDNWDANHGVEKRRNGGHRGSFIMTDEEVQEQAQAHRKFNSSNSPSPLSSDQRNVLCARCGVEVGSSGSAASTWSSPWHASSPNMGTHQTDTAGVLGDTLRLGESSRSRSPVKEFPRGPGASSRSASPARDGFQFSPQGISSTTPSNSLRRPRTEGNHLRSPGRHASPREVVRSSFAVQGHGLLEGELSGLLYRRSENSRSPRERAGLEGFQVNASRQLPFMNDGRPNTTFAGQTVGLSSSLSGTVNLSATISQPVRHLIQTSGQHSEPKAHPMGLSQSQPIGNRGEPKLHPIGLSQSQPLGTLSESRGDNETGLPPVALQSSLMKLPTITEKFDNVPKVSTQEMASRFQEAMLARGMQGSTSSPNLAGPVGSTSLNNVLPKRGKTPGLKVGRPMTSGHAMQGLSASTPSLPTTPSLPSVAGSPMQSNPPMSRSGVRRKLFGPLDQTTISPSRSRFPSGGARPMTTGAEPLSLKLSATDYPPAKAL